MFLTLVNAEVVFVEAERTQTLYHFRPLMNAGFTSVLLRSDNYLPF